MILEYQPRYIASVYYAPDDPHVTNPSQPGYVGPTPSGGGGGGGGGGGAPPDFSVPAQGGTGYAGDLPGGGYRGYPGATPTSYGSPGYTGNPNLTLTGQPFTVAPPGQQAPVDQFNVDTNPPFTVYPPGQAAPAEGTQLSSDKMSPAGLALSAMTLPGSDMFGGTYQSATGTSDQNKKDAGFFAPLGKNAPAGWAPNQTVQDLFTATYGDKAQQVWEQQNGGGAAAATPPTQQAAGGADFDTTKPFWAGSDAGYVNRADAISRLRAAGNTQNLDSFTNTQLAQTMGNAYIVGQQQQQMQQQQQAQQQQARNTILPDLLRIVQADPGAAGVANAILQQMGLPPIQGSTAPNPNGISLADWNAMSPAAQNLLLGTFPGGPNGQAAKDFLNALKSSGPTQRDMNSTPNVSYAPLAA